MFGVVSIFKDIFVNESKKNGKRGRKDDVIDAAHSRVVLFLEQSGGATRGGDLWN